MEVGTQLGRLVIRVSLLLLLFLVLVDIQPTTGRSTILGPRPLTDVGLKGGSVRVLGVLNANGEFYGDVVGVGDEGHFDMDLDTGDLSGEHLASPTSGVNRTLPTYNFEVCAPRWRDSIPCLDNAEGASGKLGASLGGERHCPRGGVAYCVIAVPPLYRLPIRWPQSRSEVYLHNVPRAQSLIEKYKENWVKLEKDKLLFRGGDIPSALGAHQYLDHIGEMLPGIGYGSRTRLALDVGCGVASFGAFLLDRDVLTLCVAPKDAPASQVALERGVPAVVVPPWATRRLQVPSQAFDLIHCARCGIAWTRDDGILLVEVDRILRAGAYFVWSPQDSQDNIWRDMEGLAKQLCWEQVGKDELLAIWRKPENNNCLRSQSLGSRPALCDATANLDETWNVPLQPCVAVLPEVASATKFPTWPARLSTPPLRLGRAAMAAGQRAWREGYKADERYWHVVVDSYLHGLGLHQDQVRNVMDMQAGLGGFATALVNLKVDWWVMNVVPISAPNTLPIIYDRGLIGVLHDWCEPFDTYPRTYDMLHAVGLFTREQKRCNLAHIVLEMDRILRPGGWVLVREPLEMATRVQALAKPLQWKTRILETESGPFGKDKLLSCQKLLWHS